MSLEGDEDRLREAACRLKLLLFDVDGVLTDGGIILGETVDGAEMEVKKFSVHDGLGLTLARAAGFKLGILTGRTSGIVSRRAREIRFDVVEQGHFDKTGAFHGILKRLDLSSAEVLYMGDDLLDLRILRKVGLPVTVASAPPLVRDACLYVAKRPAGGGAVRELIDLLLDVTDRRQAAYERLGIETG